ncbi:MAG: TraR/DksA C4-type zinc finger protein [SAR324 cluster bacterium]|nr:TraR/DksA C4-type zinc finger protein [SAR324 cluster bacterium]
MDDFAQLRQRLEQERAALAEQSAGREDAVRPVALDQSRVGRLSRMDAMQMQAMAEAAQRRRRERLRRIAAALQRIAAGEYGACLSCEEPIAAKRLESDPALTLCIACAASGD